MDIKSLLDPRARFVFLTHDDLVRAYPIAHVDDQALYFTSTNELPAIVENGHFTAARESGVVIFQKPRLEQLPYRPGELLYRINCSELDFTLSNRRLYSRHDFPEYRPVLFSYFGESIVGQMSNISEGGLKMLVDRPIRINVACRFEIRLTQDFVFRTDGVVVHSGYTDENERQAAVGISFVAPDFQNEAEKAEYFAAKKTLARLIQNWRVHVGGPA